MLLLFCYNTLSVIGVSMTTVVQVKGICIQLWKWIHSIEHILHVRTIGGDEVISIAGVTSRQLERQKLKTKSQQQFIQYGRLYTLDQFQINGLRRGVHWHMRCLSCHGYLFGCPLRVVLRVLHKIRCL